MNRLINLTNINFDNSINRTIKYIVIHYVGAENTAQNNGNYFKSVYRKASAHYFVDENDIVQVVEDKNVSWHCNTTGVYKNECRNTNSIGLEMCCKKSNDWYFEQVTVDNTIELVKELMIKHNIPVENVIRHYDVTGKICPEPYVVSEQMWMDFKNKLVVKENLTTEELSEEDIIIMEDLKRQVSDLSNRVTKLESGNVVVNNVQKYTVTAQGVNVRQYPNLSSQVVTLYSTDKLFEILEDNGTWIRCSDGWIKKSFVKNA